MTEHTLPTGWDVGTFYEDHDNLGRRITGMDFETTWGFVIDGALGIFWSALGIIVFLGFIFSPQD